MFDIRHTRVLNYIGIVKRFDYMVPQYDFIMEFIPYGAVGGDIYSRPFENK